MNLNMDKVSHKPRLFNHNWLRQREIGCKPPIGLLDGCMKSLYSKIIPSWTWDNTEAHQNSMPGGIFNLEFSPDGSLLVAACEKRSILMFDPLSRKLIHTVNDAHFDCVNCVRFLDSRVFATCSDDSTVALWDARNLHTRVRTLQGHSNWVKNIEFSQSDGLLVTSGFDGSIYTWDINSYTESGFLYKRVFHTNGLMRTRLNPDGTKMIICTTGGYLILIHDLDLSTLREDLEGFKPNMYRLMQLSQTTIPVAATFSHLFSRKRKSNRIEFVTDFPEGDDAEVVSSLQIHPQGWCALSRNISNDESSEWTCVHDIQEPEGEREEEDWLEGSLFEPIVEDTFLPMGPEGSTIPPPDFLEGILVVGADTRPRTPPAGRQRAFRRLRTVGSSNNSPFRGFPSVDPRSPSSRDGGNVVVTSTDVWEALVAIREARVRRDRNRAQERRVDGSGILMPGQEPHTRFRIVRMASGLQMSDTAQETPARVEEEAENNHQASSSAADSPSLASIVIRYRSPLRDSAPSPADAEDSQPSTSASRTIVILGSNSLSARAASSRIKVPKNHKIQKNICRLSHFIEEPNVGRGFIKELCFSSDGRLICSPFGFGVRLLAFSPNCSELSTCVPKQGPVKLFEVGTNLCHGDIVVSTKFSPRHCLLVSGCLTGRIVWHQPTV